jgi:hypothetical protein
MLYSLQLHFANPFHKNATTLEKQSQRKLTIAFECTINMRISNNEIAKDRTKYLPKSLIAFEERKDCGRQSQNKQEPIISFQESPV